MSKVTDTSARKSNHLRINLEEDVQSGLTTGLERISFSHSALPELDLQQIDLSTFFLEKRLHYPIMISSMTGGSKSATDINIALAEAAQEIGVAMGLGSQRAAIEDPSLEVSFQVRRFAPDILLFANLGAVQLNYGYGIDECRRAVGMIEGDALILHLNPLQEALQPEGDVDFSDLLRKIEGVCTQLEVPVVAKEVGWGISPRIAKQLVNAGVAVIDVAGAGGTSWSQVEMHRAQDQKQARMAAQFINWGIPTADALAGVREALPDIPLIGSGGLRNGLDIAKCIALGADICALAGPFLKAAVESSDKVREILQQLGEEIRICMFATGSGSISSLRQAKLLRRP
ncbi:MAG: type 2 isopentenyl-diphosphate Delta-isomerase [Anaerolineaceae bacterium]|nr:MAG: type 2 isopentenyl-diphosphate Delta-isomerase [Anaerolineaceae bacterium]